MLRRYLKVISDRRLNIVLPEHVAEHAVNRDALLIIPSNLSEMPLNFVPLLRLLSFMFLLWTLAVFSNFPIEFDNHELSWNKYILSNNTRQNNVTCQFYESIV